MLDDEKTSEMRSFFIHTVVKKNNSICYCVFQRAVFYDSLSFSIFLGSFCQYIYLRTITRIIYEEGNYYASFAGKCGYVFASGYRNYIA